MFIKILTIIISSLVLLYGGWRMLGSASDQLIIGKATVIDGDTLHISGERVRLYGMEAPELEQVCDYRGTKWLCGQKAALDLAAWLGQTTIVCRRRHEPGDPSIASCVKLGIDVAGWSVSRGLAVTDSCNPAPYGKKQDAARAARAGIWASTFELPMVWRQRQRGQLDPEPPLC